MVNVGNYHGKYPNKMLVLNRIKQINNSGVRLCSTDMKLNDQRLCVKAREYFGSLENAVISAGYKYIRLPTNTPYILIKEPKKEDDYAYFIGVLLGDGYISYQKNGYRVVRCDAKDKEMLLNFASSGEKIFGVKPSHFKIHKSHPNNKNDIRTYGAVAFNSRLMAEYLWKETNGKTEIPLWIKESDSENIICSFLRGFFDAEGSLDMECKMRKKKSSLICRVQYTQKSVLLLEEIKKMLTKIKIECRIYRSRYGNRPLHILIISRLDDNVRFTEMVSSSIKRKKDKMEKSKEYIEGRWKNNKHCWKRPRGYNSRKNNYSIKKVMGLAEEEIG